MTPGPFEFRVVTYEEDEARNRSPYRFKLLLLALLPYVYVFTILAVILALFSLLLWAIFAGQTRDSTTLRIELALAVVAAFFLRSIWVRESPLKGVTTRVEHAPAALSKTIRETSRAISGPRIHTILWIDECGVAIDAVPRFSLLGWPLRYYIRIGLPLLHVLSPGQFHAMLARELGLFAGAQGRIRSYRYRFGWLPVLSALTNRRRLGSWLFSRFFVWYVPFVQTYAKAATRYHAYQADRCGADVTSAAVMAEALLRIDYGLYLEHELWDEDYEQAQKESDPYAHIAELLKRPLPDRETKEWLDQKLEEETYDDQLQPGLKDRLVALGQAVHVPAPIAITAAEAYLGEDLPEITKRLDHARQERFNPGWSQPQKTLPPEYELGTQLLRKDQEEGVALLERAMELEPNQTASVCAQLSTYYKRKGDLITAEGYSRHSTAHGEHYQKALAERTQVSFIESFLPHTLSDSELQQLRAALARRKEIKAAYLVRKEVTYLPDKPLHALGLGLDRGWFEHVPEDIAFFNRLPPAMQHPTELYPFVLDYKNRRIGNVIRNVSNSLIYKKSSKNDGTK